MIGQALPTWMFTWLKQFLELLYTVACNRIKNVPLVQETDCEEKFQECWKFQIYSNYTDKLKKSNKKTAQWEWSFSV